MDTRERMPETSPGLTVMEVTPNLEIGGAQETVRTLAEHLPTVGCRTVVCSFGGGPLADDIERLGVPIEFLPSRRHSALALPAFLVEMVRRRRDLSRSSPSTRSMWSRPRAWAPSTSSS